MLRFSQCNGVLPSLPDARDYNIAKLVWGQPKLPEEFISLRPKIIKNQGSVGSCVGHALASAREIGEARQQSATELSPGYIYANRRGHVYFGEGMYPRDAIASLKKYGVCRKEVFPHNEEFPILKAKLDQVITRCDSDAVLHRITAYARLYSETDVKKALVNIGPVPVSYHLHDSFTRVKSDGIVPVPNRQKEQSLGDHMMCLVGYKMISGVTHWIVLNSWGDKWGDAGLCYIPASYKFNEAWSITDDVLPADERKIRQIKFSTKPALARQVWLDGILFELPLGIVFKDDTIMAPLRFLSEALGCAVKWDDRTTNVALSHNNVDIEMVIGSKSLKANGKITQMDAAPVVVAGNAMIPLKPIVENFKWPISYNEASGEAVITRNN